MVNEKLVFEKKKGKNYFAKVLILFSRKNEFSAEKFVYQN